MKWKVPVAALTAAAVIFGASGTAMAASPASKLPPQPAWVKQAQQSMAGMKQNFASIDANVKQAQKTVSDAFVKQQTDKQLKAASKFDGTYKAGGGTLKVSGTKFTGTSTVSYMGKTLEVKIEGVIKDAVYTSDGKQVHGKADGTFTVKGPKGEVKKSFSSQIVLDVKSKEIVRHPVSSAQVLSAYAPIDQPEVKKPAALPQITLEKPVIKKLSK